MARMLVGRAKPRGAAQTLPNLETEVAKVAYELFQRRGGQHGCDQEDWFEAERIIRQRRGNGSGR